MRSPLPAARTASLTVCQEMARAAATRAMDILSMTTDFSATASHVCSASLAGPRLSWCPAARPEHRQHTGIDERAHTMWSVSIRAAGALSVCTTARRGGILYPPQERHQASSSATRPSSTARSRLTCWPVTVRPRTSRRQKLLRSGEVKVGLDMSRSFVWAV